MEELESKINENDKIDAVAEQSTTEVPSAGYHNEPEKKEAVCVLEMTNPLFLRIGHGFGDNIMATAVIEGIRRQYANLRIFILTRRREIFVNNPNIVACYHPRRVRKKNPALYEKAICLSKYRMYEDLRVEKDSKHYIDEMYDKLPFSVRSRHYLSKVYLTDLERHYKWRKLQRMSRPLLAISPFGSLRSRIPNKIYPYEQWKEVTRQLIKAGVNIIQVGEKSEGPLLPGARDWRNIGYRRTGSVLLACDTVITHVGGIMHLATALSIPCITLFAGVEDPSVSGYKENLNLFIPLECSPCWLPKPCEDPKCKTLLSPEKIVQETLNLIKPASLVTRTCGKQKE